MTGSERRERLLELVRLFGRLGFTAFGGPAAHVAMMQDEVVERRRWMDDRRFLDLLGATNMIPGPNSTEMAIHVGVARAGWPGLVVSGLAFILPATGIVLALAWAYVEYGTTPEVEGLLDGVAPVVIAIVAQALWRLGRTAVTDLWLGALAVAVLALYLAGANELVLLFGGGAFMMLGRNVPRLVRANRHAGVILPGLVTGTLASIPVARVPEELGRLFLTFLKIGAVLYGSGYVLLAFLRGDLVERLGWLTERQLLDAVAIGQVTPGPLFTTATFVGYVVLGVPGALVATAGIFLPSFVFVAAVNPLIPRMRRSPWFGALLDGVNVSALALMAGVTYQLGRAAVVDGPTAVLALASAALLFRFRLSSAWIVLGGAAIGLALRGFG
jgi:chromate transporter